jgi:hypothetical protein
VPSLFEIIGPVDFQKTPEYVYKLFARQKGLTFHLGEVRHYYDYMFIYTENCLP